MANHHERPSAVILKSNYTRGPKGALLPVMLQISNFAPVADVAADVAQFLDIWNPLCLCSASQSTGIINLILIFSLYLSKRKT